MAEQSKEFKKAFNSILRYCQYQERSSKEVISKLKSFYLNTKDFDEIYSYLIDNEFFCDERFVRNFVRSKLSKSWGRIKIRYHLRAKVDNVDLIDDIMEDIDIEEYIETIKELIDSKYHKLDKEEDFYKKKQKISLFLQNRGFESSLIFEELNKYKW